MKSFRFKSLVLVLGDAAVFYAGLALALLLRYGPAEFEKWWNLHILPFSALFILWLAIFGVTGLYDPLSFANPRHVREMIVRAMLFAGVLGMAIFYFWTDTAITPKTNLILDIAMTTALLFLWRKIYHAVLAKSEKTRVAFLGWSDEVREIANTIKNNPHLGYEVSADLPFFSPGERLLEEIKQKKIDMIVASFEAGKNEDMIKLIYEALPMGVAYVDFPGFYEQITGRVPVSVIDEMWFLENINEERKRFFEAVKRGFDVLAGIILGLLALAVLPFAALAIKLESSGPVFFRQSRVGKNGRVFELVKFRSKKHDDEWRNSGWNKTEDEKRTTLIGKILRKTYIDELPQALNIIKGEMSLIGPRPERPEFVEELKGKVPHYMMRLLARPGISGWAQINMQYDASAKDALEKLQYDLYYIKNRSFALEGIVALKTLFAMLSRPGK